jgi:predicted nucleic acid-binding protein
LVVDASLLVEALIGGPGPAVERIKGRQLFAPHLIDVEVANALRRKVATGELAADYAAAAMFVDSHFEITRYPHAGLLARAWELRHNLTMYDAVYIALAEILEVPLVTRDAAMAGVPGTLCAVEVVPPGT